MLRFGFHRRQILAIAALLCAAAPVRAASLDAGDHEVSIEHAGRVRVGFVHVPPTELRSVDRPWPVVVAFHGGGGRAEQFRDYAGLGAVADRSGFVVVYPDGIPGGRWIARRFHTWNAGGCCGAALEQQVDDTGFVWALLAELSRDLPLDPERVYATGHSNGAMMAYRLAADSADRVAAIAPVAGAMLLADFAPSRPVPVLHIHSVDDPRALYAGGVGPRFPFTRRRVEHNAVETELEKWAALAGCRGEGNVVREHERGGHRAEWLDYGPCASGAAVELLRLHGPGHGWPGAAGLERQARLERLLGPPSDVVDAATEAWAFFARFVRAGAPALDPQREASR